MRRKMNTEPVYYSKYTGVSILLVIFLFAITIGYQQLEWPWWTVFIPVLIYLVLLALGSVFIRFNFFFPSVCKAKTKEKKIVLTFDDGPHPELTPEMLKILDKHEFQAIFFCTGAQVHRYKDIVKKMDKKGHIIANHSYTHSRWFDFFNLKKMTAEIAATNKEIERAIGKKPLLFRPPYGVTNPALGKTLQRTGLVSVGWSLRSFDTIHSKEKVLKKLKRKTKSGDIVLLHDTRENTPAIVDEYAAWLKENGFKVSPLDKLLNIKVYEEY